MNEELQDLVKKYSETKKAASQLIKIFAENGIFTLNDFKRVRYGDLMDMPGCGKVLKGTIKKIFSEVVSTAIRMPKRYGPVNRNRHKKYIIRVVIENEAWFQKAKAIVGDKVKMPEHFDGGSVGGWLMLYFEHLGPIGDEPMVRDLLDNGFNLIFSKNLTDEIANF